MNLFPENTDTKETEISEKFYEEIYSKADIFYFSINPKGTITSCNITLCETLDYEKNELLGKNFLIIIPGKDKKDAENVLKGCLSRGYVKDKRLSFQEHNGRSIQIKLNGIVIQDRAHNILGIRFVCLDLSEKIQFEKQNRLSFHILEWR